MARLAIPAIRRALQARLLASTALVAACPGGFRGAPSSDVESDADQVGGTLFPYVSVAISQGGEIQTGLRGSTEKGDISVLVLVWVKRAAPKETGKYAEAMAAGDLLGDLLDGWSHSETGLRWIFKRSQEMETQSQQEGGGLLDGLGAVWVADVKYC